jgi:xanthine dehydrogenase molybdenum-binding subunit
MADTDNYQHIGKNFVPPDIVGKVTGRAKYTADVSVDGMLYARMYVSPIPHGRVTHLDLSESLALDGVFGALTADDVPPANSADRTILTNEPMYVGEPIFAIAAVDERTAENAIALARITIEPLPFEVDPLSSLRTGGANANTQGNIYVGGEGSGLKDLKWSEQELQNFVNKQSMPDEVINEWQYGDLEQGFADASIVIEEPFVTSGYAHMCMDYY